MEAGRELDALVAKKVFGWAIRRESWYDQEGLETTVLYDSHDNQLGYAHGFDEMPEELPEYSTNIAAAWQVFDRPEHEAWSIYRWDSAMLEAGCQWEIEDADGNTLASAPTAPLAICLAALSAVGAEVPV